MRTVLNPPTDRVAIGPRTILVAVLAAVATFAPSLALIATPLLAVTVFLFGRPGRLRVDATVGWTIALVAWMALSGLWTANPDHLTAVLTGVAPAVMFIVIIDFIRTRQQLRAVAIGYLVGASFAVVRMVIETPDILSAVRVTTVFSNVNVNYVGYALAAAFSLVVLLWVTAPRKTLRLRLSLFIVVVAILLGIEITDTRGAYLGILAAVAWMLFYVMFNIRSLWLISLVLTGAVFALITGVADRASLAFEIGERATGDWSGRLGLWETARAIWAENPIIGVGLGGFRQVSGHGIAAHSVVLDLGTGLGVIGLGFFFAMLISALWRGTLFVDRRKRALLIGVFLAASAPAYLTGVWDSSPAAWIVLAIFTRITVLADPPTAPGEERAARRSGLRPVSDPLPRRP